MDSESNYNQALIKLKLRDSISTLEIYNLNKINSELRSKSTACEEAISNQSLLLDLRQKEVYDLNKKILKKSKFNNFFKVFTPTLAVVTGLLLIKS